jgi:hypothetical protein
MNRQKLGYPAFSHSDHPLSTTTQAALRTPREAADNAQKSSGSVSG